MNMRGDNFIHCCQYMTPCPKMSLLWLAISLTNINRFWTCSTYLYSATLYWRCGSVCLSSVCPSVTSRSSITKTAKRISHNHRIRVTGIAKN